MQPRPRVFSRFIRLLIIKIPTGKKQNGLQGLSVEVFFDVAGTGSGAHPSTRLRMNGYEEFR
jgi:hypothetical protein